MSFQIRSVQSFTTTLTGTPEAAYGLLSGLAAQGVNLLAFTAIPVGPGATQLVLCPEDDALLAHAARRLNVALSGPEEALLLQGDDELGALAKVHDQLASAGVQPYASIGLADGRGSFAYVLHMRRGTAAAARQALALPR